MKLKSAVLILVLALSISSFIIAANASPNEVDRTCIVTSITDGDTFKVEPDDTVRLADIDCPEYRETGFAEAKDYLEGMISGKTVYLDIDDLYRTDRWGRLICVVFVDHNTTHWININKALLEGEFATITDHPNEFSPYSWSYFTLKQESFFELSPMSLVFLIAAILSVAMVALLISRKKTKP